jgi:hypothetical protein
VKDKQVCTKATRKPRVLEHNTVFKMNLSDLNKLKLFLEVAFEHSISLCLRFQCLKDLYFVNQNQNVTQLTQLLPRHTLCNKRVLTTLIENGGTFLVPPDLHVFAPTKTCVFAPTGLLKKMLFSKRSEFGPTHLFMTRICSHRHPLFI